MADSVFLREIGHRLAQLRLGKNMTQGQLAEQAGLGWRTVQRMESGEAATRLSSFIRVCRVLGLVERFDVLVPEPAVSPMDLLRLQGRQRKRARARKISSKVAEEPKQWTWGKSS